jgi:hypothetical protein
MGIIRIDADKQWQELADSEQKKNGFVAALPRRIEYGKAPLLIPYGEAYPDDLVDPKDYKEVIADCHARQIFAVYHQHATWAPPGFKWNQNGLGYCWAWGGTACLMDCLAREHRKFSLLSPITMGWLVNWANRGNYLSSMIEGLMTRGVAEMSYTPDMHSRSYKSYKAGWEDNALLHRLDKVFDTDPRKMTQHAISVMARTGSGGYIAYNWWGHALECVGVRWDESVVNNLVWLIRNSHDEDDIIEMTGNRAVPDEFYGFAASKTN